MAATRTSRTSFQEPPPNQYQWSWPANDCGSGVNPAYTDFADLRQQLSAAAADDSRRLFLSEDDIDQDPDRDPKAFLIKGPGSNAMADHGEPCDPPSYAVRVPDRIIDIQIELSAINEINQLEGFL